MAVRSLTFRMKFPTSPQMLGVADTVDAAEVELWFEIVAELDKVLPAADDDEIVVELENCSGRDE